MVEEDLPNITQEEIENMELKFSSITVYVFEETECTWVDYCLHIQDKLATITKLVDNDKTDEIIDCDISGWYNG